jgi:hypothetical protein
MQTPVALIIFNRPHITEQVFAQIAKAKPRKLFVIADGPRPDRPGDGEKCAAARAIVERVDWECEVIKSYSDVNLGCGRRPATGISWVFEQVEEAIILEDDCVPRQTFFGFCEELLQRYRDDERVMMIAGSNHWFGQKRIAYSYHFSCLPWCWGWATWRRAWQHFDIEMKLWPEIRNACLLKDVLGDTVAVEAWQKRFDTAYAGRGNVDYWDYQWTFACWAQNGLCVFPNTNVISNIGFGKDATHTMDVNSIVNDIPASEMEFPLQHPPYVVRDKEIDQFRIDRSPAVNLLREQQQIYRRLRRKLSAFIPAPLWKTVSHLRSRLMEL